MAEQSSQGNDSHCIHREELIIFIIALVKNEIRIVQASLLGSILANLLLIMTTTRGKQLARED
jgi:hypothetical protein